MKAFRTLLAAGCLSAAWAGFAGDVSIGLYPGFRFIDRGAGFYLMGAEADVTARVSSRTRDILTGLVQLWVTAPGHQDWKMGYHYGQAYALIPLGLQRPTIRVGQAVVPFGLLADYDTHAQIVHTQFFRTVGQRIDLGAGVLGNLGRTDYWLWVSNGSGPYRIDPDLNKVVTARVAPKFLLGDAELTAGASALAGRLPRDWRDSTNAPAPVMKYRVALDNTTDWGPVTLRLEGVAGKDSTLTEPLRFGYFAEARYAFVAWLEALVKNDEWHTPDGTFGNVSGGLTFYPPNVSAFFVSAMYEHNYTIQGGTRDTDWDIATQLSIRF